ncbi:hypothetical protein Taro_033944 [Colocasia esculenta]|uniref:Uncharacterized protein n=1 Tax=Colocasia esculenta TaxID=4460 RepID=A0A843VQ19_COLES|nr:hypothetical protein [Colocasia esculenta]
MEVLHPVPNQPLGILLTKGTVPLKDNTTPSTIAGLLLFPRQEDCQPLGGLQGLQAWKKEFS